MKPDGRAAQILRDRLFQQALEGFGSEDVFASILLLNSTNALASTCVTSKLSLLSHRNNISTAAGDSVGCSSGHFFEICRIVENFGHQGSPVTFFHKDAILTF